MAVLGSLFRGLVRQLPGIIGGAAGGALMNGGGQNMPTPGAMYPGTPGFSGPLLPMGDTGGFGLPRGPGGGLQLPWNDPSIPGFAKPYALDDSYLRVQYRAPAGYVVVRDKDQRPFALERGMAIKMRVWKPGAKPPISAGDWKKFKTAARVSRKLKKIAGEAVKYERKKTVYTGTTTCRTRKKVCK